MSKSTKAEGRAFINGQYVNSMSGEVFASYSPIDGEFLTNIDACNEQDIHHAVLGARRSFESGVWSAMPLQERKNVLFKLADLIIEHEEELAVLETLDMGKPVSLCLESDIRGGAHAIRWFAECIDKLYDHMSPNHQGIGMITREPIGVVGAITPWNFPFYMAIWKVGSALAMGNSVVVKPSERASLTTIKLGELAHKAGVPEGVLQIVPGYGRVAGAALGRHSDVDCISFTGSHTTSRELMKYSSETNGKPVHIEAGGKTANIVFKDALNLEEAAQVSAQAIFYNMGEVCFAGSRLLLPDDEDFIETFLSKVKNYSEYWQPYNPLDMQSMAGALVDAAHLQRVENFVQGALDQGAQLFTGGKIKHPDSGGYYYEPTILTGVTPDMTIAQEEVFGPVLSVMTYQDEEDAIRIANGTDYGLASAIWTGDLNRAHRVSRAMKSGNVWVNCFHGGDMTMPFGGYKQSGNTRDKAFTGFEKYTQIKSTWIALGLRILVNVNAHSGAS
ncbi:aldehyde dehydrogenase [Endozoicomonas atrinae]|uniref:aldehyde dehydrogenase n=1 Tax=Endozoicomonas atrinae TaxID=1333660 RepID=UPI003AFFE6CF